MQPDDWSRVKALFNEALELPPADRASLLDRACATDAALRGEVESLLAFADQDGPLGPTAAKHAASAIEAVADPNFGTRLGAYRILRELGRGGMGAVYLAERVDGEFQQQVAIKIVRRSIADPDLEQRFRVERQVLASLEHPHIARLLDGGVNDAGEPYFVMEYVPGEPLLDFATRTGLGIRARLEIFRKVCAAVSYAHAKLVVHRDLKPTNILVPAAPPSAPSRRPTPRPSRCTASRSPRPATSIRSAWCSTSCSPAASRSTSAAARWPTCSARSTPRPPGGRARCWRGWTAARRCPTVPPPSRAISIPSSWPRCAASPSGAIRRSPRSPRTCSATSMAAR